ncbi:MAG TPA: hypothetical protein VML75_23585 [Kofleriaceae bacterium]|nr:hypothetical protein [Kofleriaceae bacterium]
MGGEAGRSDRFMVCAECGLRTHQAARCPSCAEPLLDLRDDIEREQACRQLLQSASYRQPGIIGFFHRLRRRAKRALARLPLWPKLIIYPMLAVLWVIGVMCAMVGIWLVACLCAFAGAGLGLALGYWLRLAIGSGTAGTIALFAPLCLGFGAGGIGGLLALDKLTSWLARRREQLIAAGALRLRVPELPAPDLRADITTFSGCVVAADTVRAPVSGRRCAVFRLRGQGKHGVIDDGDATRFEIRGADGQRAVVEGEGAWLAIDDSGEPRQLTPDGELAEFLRPRGALIDLGAVELREIVLVDGDRVIVEGAAEDVADPNGYRDSSFVRQFRDRDGAPLVIRPA